MDLLVIDEADNHFYYQRYWLINITAILGKSHAWKEGNLYSACALQQVQTHLIYSPVATAVNKEAQPPLSGSRPTTVTTLLSLCKQRWHPAFVDAI